MEYQEQFNEFFEKFLEENNKLSVKKIKNILYKSLFYLLKITKQEKGNMYFNLKKVQNNVFEMKGKEYLITTRNIAPKRYSRLIDLYAIEYQAMHSFYALICSLKTLIDSYKENEKIHLMILHALLSMYSYFFNEEVDTFENCVDRCFDAFNQQEIPSLFSPKIAEYIQFFNQMICQYEAFDYKSYQKELLKKNTNE